MKVCFLIVIYNKQLDKSTSLKTLIDLMSKRKEMAYLRVVNNGPKEILNELDYTENIIVDFQQSITNRPLSMIYNDFIKDYDGFDRFIILDDDSKLSKEYIDRIYSSEVYDLELPKVYNNSNEIISPLLNWKFIDKGRSNLKSSEGFILSVGSGLVIDKSLLYLFKSLEILPFNEALSLYGVDSSFFLELRKKNFSKIIITSKSYIYHNISLHGKISNFKKYELYINYALQMRHYPNLDNFKILSFHILKNLKNKDFKLLKAMFTIYFKGIHPNSLKHKRF